MESRCHSKELSALMNIEIQRLNMELNTEDAKMSIIN